MAALRRISMLSARYDFRIQAKYIMYYPGSENIVADAVCRLHEPRGFERFQNAVRIHPSTNGIPVNEHPEP